MTTITLDLSESLVRQASQAARLMHRPLEQVLAVLLEAALPPLDDCPPELQTQLIEMTWLSDGALMDIATSSMSESDQRRLADLGLRAGALTAEEQEELAALRERYGELTLRKARAYALLSIRGGERLLAHAAAA
jgi:actin-like ATPase involved in cell morphogenesis